MKSLLIALFSICLGATGQILLKRGMVDFGQVDMRNIWTSLPRIFLIPYIPIGFFCFALSAVLWLVVISKLQLSYAYPLVSLSYIIILFVSAIWFNESVGTIRILGVALICCGVVLVARS